MSFTMAGGAEDYQIPRAVKNIPESKFSIKRFDVMHMKFKGRLSFFGTVSTFASCSLQGSGRGLRPSKMLSISI